MLLPAFNYLCPHSAPGRPGGLNPLANGDDEPGEPDELSPGEPEEVPPMNPRPPGELPMPDQPDELPEPQPGEVQPGQPPELPQPGDRM